MIIKYKSSKDYITTNNKITLEELLTEEKKNPLKIFRINEIPEFIILLSNNIIKNKSDKKISDKEILEIVEKNLNKNCKNLHEKIKKELNIENSENNIFEIITLVKDKLSSGEVKDIVETNFRKIEKPNDKCLTKIKMQDEKIEKKAIIEDNTKMILPKKIKKDSRSLLDKIKSNKITTNLNKANYTNDLDIKKNIYLSKKYGNQKKPRSV